MKPRVFYETQARELVREIREQKKISYDQLAKRLVAHGVVLETQALTNKINRGRYNFAFALQLLAALDVKMLRLPDVLDPERSRIPETGLWRPENAPPGRRRSATTTPERACDDLDEPN